MKSKNSANENDQKDMLRTDDSIMLDKLGSVARTLGLQEDTIRRAEGIYKDCEGMGLTDGKPGELMIRAAVFASCKDFGVEEKQRILNVMVVTSKYTRTMIFETSYEALQAHYVVSHANALRLGDEVKKPALHILESMMRLRRTRTQFLGNPSVSAAAAVYVAAIYAEEHRIEDEVAAVAGVSHVTIQNWSDCMKSFAKRAYEAGDLEIPVKTVTEKDRLVAQKDLNSLLKECIERLGLDEEVQKEAMSILSKATEGEHHLNFDGDLRGYAAAAVYIAAASTGEYRTQEEIARTCGVAKKTLSCDYRALKAWKETSAQESQ
jgi:transcription initiation factor TFIIIB Brf1 subunit/transcription initiation factor TFIIB